MRLGAFCCVYNQERFIGPAIEQLLPYVEEFVVHVSKTPWVGDPEPEDRTVQLVQRYFVDEVRPEDRKVRLYHETWPDEACQRNQALGKLRWCDYVWVVDADEYYTRHDIGKIFAQVADTKQDVYTIKQRSYWKTPDWRWEPGDTWPPAILVNPKRTFFYHCRAVVQGLEECALTQHVFMHHFNYVRTDAELESKMKHFSHAGDIRPEWWRTAWKGWEPGSSVDICPYRGSWRPQAIYDPAPQEIIDRFQQWQEKLT